MVQVGSDINLTCRAEESPEAPAAVVWYKNEERVDNLLARSVSFIYLLHCHQIGICLHSISCFLTFKGVAYLWSQNQGDEPPIFWYPKSTKRMLEITHVYPVMLERIQ